MKRLGGVVVNTAVAAASSGAEADPLQSKTRIHFDPDYLSGEKVDFF